MFFVCSSCISKKQSRAQAELGMFTIVLCSVLYFASSSSRTDRRLLCARIAFKVEPINILFLPSDCRILLCGNDSVHTYTVDWKEASRFILLYGAVGQDVILQLTVPGLLIAEGDPALIGAGITKDQQAATLPALRSIILLRIWCGISLVSGSRV